MKKPAPKPVKKEGTRKEVAQDKRQQVKSPKFRKGSWDSNRWENSSADGIA